LKIVDLPFFEPPRSKIDFSGKRGSKYFKIVNLS